MAECRGALLAERGDLRVIQCEICGFAHLDKFTAADAEFYKSQFWQKEKVGALERFLEQRDWLTLQHGDWLTLVEKQALGRTLLDVGAGYGFFLQDAQARGWHGLGLEPSLESSVYTLNQNLRVIADGWEHSGLTGKFDCVSALWLIEHLPDPVAFLRWCRARLYGGGALLLVVPNEWNHYQSVANTLSAVKNYWLHYTHYSYFSFASICNLLGRCGFRITNLTATYPMETAILCGIDYTADSSLGRECHIKIEREEMKETYGQRLDRLGDFARSSLGRDAVIVAVPE